jgi:hypothetical protein
MQNLVFITVQKYQLTEAQRQQLAPDMSGYLHTITLPTESEAGGHRAVCVKKREIPVLLMQLKSFPFIYDLFNNSVGISDYIQHQITQC